jgi:hypothetical protein
MTQAELDARIDMICSIDPCNGNIHAQADLIKNLRILSIHYISDDIDEEYN